MAKPNNFAEQVSRAEESKAKRLQAADIAKARTDAILDPATAISPHMTNGDEALASKAMSFTKGLTHDPHTGLVNSSADFDALVKAIDSGDPADYKVINTGDSGNYSWRAWESGSAGLTYDLQGPDSHAVTMPPSPGLNHQFDILTGEIAELYAQALLRDVHFGVFSMNKNIYLDFVGQYTNNYHWYKKEWNKAEDVVDSLASFSFDHRKSPAPFNLLTAFRGFTQGDIDGPYLSQFLLSGDNGLNTKNDDSPEHDACDGFIRYGAQVIDQRVRQASKKDYLTSWNEWLLIQNGGDARGLEQYKGNNRRFITTPRDLATFVHYDALYQAYLNACILLLNIEAPFGDGIPFSDGNDLNDKQQGFALYGGPHILTLVTEVATRALKAVRYQKFNVHRRLRPEALAARLEKATHMPDEIKNKIVTMRQQIADSGLMNRLLDKSGNLLLPMAFAEGSPMHPSYGAGHATVAGACVTMLKAFFKGDNFIHVSKNGEAITVDEHCHQGDYAFVPSLDGRRLRVVEVSQSLTLEGELNKLAANISIGRDWAGVHYYSDYYESMLMGEEIAVGILQEQTITHNSLENLSYKFTSFEGNHVVIKDGQVILNP
ncbi:vanadium-dependent haloperoxidase [Alteromonas sp. D210916BOD_24]|uniref:vanadium-dependent haloperoxidase n=1 Tax=Alteromonas sp. D210916BOD_24 TaxID=3157618 RepID=UPI00399D4FD9